MLRCGSHHQPQPSLSPARLVRAIERILRAQLRAPECIAAVRGMLDAMSDPGSGTGRAAAAEASAGRTRQTPATRTRHVSPPLLATYDEWIAERTAESAAGNGDSAAWLRNRRFYRGYLAAFLGDEARVQDLTKSALAEYIRTRLGSVQPRTVAKEYYNLRTFSAWLVEHGLLAAAPTDGLKVKLRIPKVDRYRSPDEVRAVLALAPEARRRWMLLAAGAGMRPPSEVESVCWSALDLDRWTIGRPELPGCTT